MKRPTLLATIVFSTLFVSLVGCVPYETYEEIRRDYDIVYKSNRDLAAKYNRILQELGRTGGDVSSLQMDNLKALLQDKDNQVQLLQAKLTDLEKTSISFPDDVEQKVPGAKVGDKGEIILGDLLFSPGSASLTSSGKNTLSKLATLLKTDYSNELFNIVGHTDNTPLLKTKKLFEYNLKLGFERAYTVFKYLNMEHGIQEQQVRLHTFGFTEPTSPAAKDTDAGRAKNRRVEIYRSGFTF